MVRIRYTDIAPNAKPSFTPTAAVESYSNLNTLKQDEVEFPNFANPCALYSVLLDDSAPIFPSNPQSKTFGLVSKEISQADGSFATPVALTLTAAGQYSSQGITLTFDPAKNQWATDVRIQWYRDGVLLSNKQYRPDSTTYYCQNQVQNYNKVVMTFLKLNMPQNRLVLQVYSHGVVRDFFGDELEKVNLIQEVSPLSSEISVNVCDFTLNSKDDVDFLFQQKQAIEVYHGQQLKTVCFVDEAKRTARRKYSVSTIDYIGLLDKITFYGGMYSNKSAAALIGEILRGVRLENDYVPYVIDASLQSKTVSGFLPITTGRAALAQVLFAIGAVCDTADSDKVRIFPLSTSVKATIPLEKIYKGQQFSEGEKVSEVQLVAHTYTPGSEESELYKATDSGTGTVQVEFSEPRHSLSIVNGTIVESGANYARITANSGCVLKGKQYNHTTRVYSVVNPVWNAGDIKVVKKIESVTLSSNAQETAQRCYNYLSKWHSVRAGIVAENIKPGDTITMDTAFLGQITGTVERMKYSLSNSQFVKAEVELK